MKFSSGESNLVTLLLIVINIASKNPLILKDLIDNERKNGYEEDCISEASNDYNYFHFDDI
jgi:hypothetical protein